MLYMYVYTYVICIYIYIYVSILYVYIYMSIGTMCILYICNRYSEFYMPYSRDALKKELVDSKTGMCVCVCGNHWVFDPKKVLDLLTPHDVRNKHPMTWVLA